MPRLLTRFDVLSIAFMGFAPVRSRDDAMKAALIKAVFPTELRKVMALNEFAARRYYFERNSYFVATSAFLVGAITHVIKLCPNKEMIGSYTGWIVTLVTDIERTVKRAVSKFIRQSMSEDISAVSAAGNDCSIARFVLRAIPYPASLAFGHFKPEAFVNRSAFSISCHRNGLAEQGMPVNKSISGG